MSGFNRFRNVDKPLEDEKNSQLDVFMNIAGFLRPKFTLMENVVDILNFRDLPGVIVDAVTKVASLDLNNRVFLESGKPLVKKWS